MRRSVRRSINAASERQAPRAESPAPSEPSVRITTPSVSPTPMVPTRQYATPGQRSDGAPKRPMNAFILFSNEKRSELADQNPTLSNAAVSVLLGQVWREMSAHDKSGYVAAARKIKEQFHADHPDARTRCVSRKAKRKHDGAGGPSRRGVARPRLAAAAEPPSLHALALVGARLNQNAPSESAQYQRSSTASTYSTYSRPSFDDDDDAVADEQRDFGDDDDEDDEDDERSSEHTIGAGVYGGGGGSLSLLEQLCTVAESEHTAAARALSAFGGC